MADDGSIFVADGHADTTNNRVVKFDAEGNYLMEWGQTGYAPGEFRTLHGIALDNDGRLFVADRSNNRVQIFDQEGNFLSQWTQFGRPSGITFDPHGRVYVADSESDDVQNPGWEMGIRIGDAKTGWVDEFIPFVWGDPREVAGNGAEFVAVDAAGNIYGGEPRAAQPAEVRAREAVARAESVVHSSVRGSCRPAHGAVLPIPASSPLNEALTRGPEVP